MASNNERLLAAAKSDNEDLLFEVFEQGDFDINHADGLGNTALHYASSMPSPDVIDHILSYEECDVDPVNRLQKATPLHLAVKIPDPELRFYIVQTLLEAGADIRIKDKFGSLAIDLVASDDLKTKAAIRKAQGLASISKADIVHDDDDEPDSGSVPSDDD